MTAKRIKELAEDLGLEKVDCRSNFFWVRDNEGARRLGHFYRGIGRINFVRQVESAKAYGDIIEAPILAAIDHLDEVGPVR